MTHAAFYWPAYDRNVPPAPYCAQHMAEAKAVTVLEGPRFIEIKEKTPELTTV